MAEDQRGDQLQGDPPAGRPLQLPAAVIQQLESLQRVGVRQIARPARRQTGVSEMGSTRRPDEGPKAGDREAGDREAALLRLSQQVAECTHCSELCTARTQTVFGVGNSHARLCFLGEAPGADEDRQGEPFVGRAGQLLTKIIEAMKLQRPDVYILNVLKCRPPGNRNPAPDEVENCRPFFEQQIDIIRPEFICCLGAVAATNLLGSKLSIGKLRGRFHDWNGYQVLATYHPAYLLRNPAAKADTWADMQILMRAMGLQVPR